MLKDYPLTPRLPAADLDRARAWYEDKLGLVPDSIEMGGAWYQTGGGWFYLYPTPSAGTAQNTAAGWTVTSIETVMDELRGRGITFEEYDFGDMGRTDRRLLSTPGGKEAWVKDSEGNLLGVGQSV